MLKNYLKIAIRNLRKRKGYSFINIFGLSIGVATAVLITLYAVNQLSFDAFNKHAKDIYLVYKQRVTPTGTQDTYDTWVPLKGELEQTYASVKQAARVNTEQAWVEHGNKKFQENITYTDPELFKMFTFPLLKGDAQHPFTNLQSIILSQAMAKKYFGNQDPIGKTLTLNYKRSYTVSGVLKPIPQNSSVQIDMAVPMKSAPGYDKMKNAWGSSFLNTFVQLKKGDEPASLEAQFRGLITKIWDADVAGRTTFKLLPLTQMNNRFNNSNRYAYILLGIALAIIIIAGINFMNMSTARSLERAREVGMRKALGGLRGQLIAQFLGESTLLSLLAVVFGTGLAEWVMPFFNSFFEVELTVFHPEYLAALIVFGILLGLLSGSYPALYLSRFSSIETLRGRLKNRAGGAALRKALVVCQFAITVVILISTLIMRKQVHYMEQADLGFQKHNILAIRVNPDDFENPKQAATRLETFKNELANSSSVASVSSSMTIPGQSYGHFIFARPEGWTNSNPMRVRYAFTDANFFTTYNIKLLKGRSFRKGSQADEDGSVIINKAALDDFGWTTGVGKTISLGSSGSHKLTVIGVVQNYNYQSLQNPVKPVLHVFRTPESGIHNYVSVRLQSGNIPAVVAMIKKQWNKVDAVMPMNYFFVDQNFNRLYRTQEQLVTVIGIFSLLAMVIACLGLLGLVSLMIAQRTKEIGIRKVLGASTRRIILLVSKDFMLLVVCGLVLALPVAYYLMSAWLQNFAYQAAMPVGAFVAGGLFVIAAALLIIVLRGFRAATVNPVDSLRSE